MSSWIGKDSCAVVELVAVGVCKIYTSLFISRLSIAWSYGYQKDD